MPKKISFAEKDFELIQQIEAFKKMQNLPSFVEAVRVLCKSGLNINELIKSVK